MSRAVHVRAPAKVNLRLEVLGRRPDGYHDLRMLMAPVSWYDEVSVEPLDEAGRVELAGWGPVPAPGDDNLCCRAARFFLERTGVRAGVRIRLTKRIPTGAGLGGGSSDAAATVLGLERLFGHELTHRDRADVAFAVGADVPFFFSGGPAWVGGIGERVRPLRADRRLWLVVVWPGVFLSTARVFSGLNQGLTSPGPAPRIAQFNFQGIVGLLRNDLEPPARTAEPAVGAALDALARAGARHRLMSGSGSSVFGLFRDEDEARAAAERLDGFTEAAGWQVRVVHTLCAP